MKGRIKSFVTYLDSPMQIRDQYHNLLVDYWHENNLNQESLFVVVMGH